MLRIVHVLTLLLVCTVVSAQDTTVRAGVIRVKKPVLKPYVKVEYELTLAHVTRVPVEVPVNNGIPGYREIIRMPVYDSALYPENLERVYPSKNLTLSRYFSQRLDFMYAAQDTNSVDTMYLGVWINRSGKISYVDPDTAGADSMPPALKEQLSSIALSLEGQTWGKGGGYKTEKHFMKPSEFVGESYYCKIRIIVSGAPLTVDQRISGSRPAPFDIPLNSPPSDSTHAEFVRRNTGH